MYIHDIILYSQFYTKTFHIYIVMNEIIISQLCSAEGLQTNSMSTGGIQLQGDVNPAVDGSAYEELTLSLQYCMEYILGRWRMDCVFWYC